MPTFECKEAIVTLLNQYNATDVVAIEYTVNEDEEGFTIEATGVNVRNGESIEDLAAYEYNQELTDELNELLFDFLEDFNGEDDPADGLIQL